MEKISPKYRISLIRKISDELWRQFGSYAEVLAYIKEWHNETEDRDFYSENFAIIYQDISRKKVDLVQTLQNMPDELTIKIAIDLGIETPDFIPSIPTFRNEIKANYSNASEIFEKSLRHVESDPSMAIGLANSALESILKDILINSKFAGYNEHDSLTELVKKLNKLMKLKDESVPQEIHLISNSFINAAKSIEDLRSNKTAFHGKSAGSAIVVDPAFAYFILNAVSTIGLFALNYCKKFKAEQVIISSIDDDELPF